MHLYNRNGAGWEKNHLLPTVYTTHYAIIRCGSFFYALLGFIYPKTWLCEFKAWMLTLHRWCRHSSYWLMCIDSWQRPAGALPVAMDLMTVSVKASLYVRPAFLCFSGKKAACVVSLQSVLCSGENVSNVFLYFTLTYVEALSVDCPHLWIMAPLKPQEVSYNQWWTARVCPDQVIISNAIAL